MLGVVVVVILGRHLFTDPPVHYAVTIPGSTGEAVAFMAEMAISFVLMTTILALVASPRLIRFTGLAVGCVVAFFIIVEGPFSGASMNPARTLASAVPGMVWQHVWIYLLAPTLGMLIAAQRHLYARTGGPHGCAKLLHPSDVRCIHCGFLSRPTRDGRGQIRKCIEESKARCSVHRYGKRGVTCITVLFCNSHRL